MRHNLAVAGDYVLACAFTAAYLPYLVVLFVLEQLYRTGGPSNG